MKWETRKFIKEKLFSNWPFLYLFLFTGLIFAAFSDWVYDDPFITYRYARNLGNGFGFVYNANERILSTTTPLYTLILATVHIFSKNIPEISILIGVVSLSASALLIWKLAVLKKLSLVGVTFVLLFPTFPLLIRTLGSEMPLYLAFCLGTFTFYAHKRYTVSAVFLALATLTRPDGILVCIPLAIHYIIIIRKPLLWKPLVAFLLITFPWYIFSWFYFGSAFPVTLAAKQHQGLMEISQRFAPGTITIFMPYLQLWIFRLEILLAVIGLLIIFSRFRFWLIIITWNILYFSAYLILGVTRYFWYYAPLISGLILSVSFGINSIPLFWKKKLPKSTHWSHALVGIVIGALTFGQYFYLWNMHTRIDTRAHIYRAVGEWLESNTPEDARVGTLEVGLIGYYSLRPMIDFAGLIQPEVALQLKPGTTYEDAAIWATGYYKPDYLVLQTGIFPDLQQGYIKQYCRVEKQFKATDYAYGADIDIFSCSPEETRKNSYAFYEPT